MAYSQITLTFSANLTPTNTIRITNYPDGPDGIIDVWTETWLALRTSNGYVTTGTPTTTAGERAAINFVAAFNLDYNSLAQFEVTRTENVVVIKALSPIHEFIAAGVYETSSLEDEISGVAFDIENFAGTVFLVESVTFSEADTNPCGMIKVTVEMSSDPSEITTPVNYETTDNPLEFEWIRGQSILISVRSEDDVYATKTVRTPNILDPTRLSINLNYTPSGGTATANYNTLGEFSPQLAIEYSLDGTTWQSTTQFAGLTEGDYTLYVRDEYGCSFTKDFAVSATGAPGPFFYLSTANSIRYAERITWGINGNYKNDDNTLGCEWTPPPFGVAHCGCQKFQTADIITTQIKSNYQTIAAHVIQSDGTETALIVDKKSANIGIKDKRDGFKYNRGDGKTGIYFTIGNTYDFDAGTVSGTHSLNGSLPYWGVKGGYVILGVTWYQIEDVVFDESRNAEVIVIANVYTGSDVAVIAGSIFNYQNYEVYEYAVDMADYQDEKIQVRVTATDPTYDEVEYISEPLDIQLRHADTVQIQYRNPTNTDIFYSTGISHLMRVSLTQSGAADEDENNANRADDTVSLLSASTYQGEEFTFEPVTKQIARKIKIALSHKIVAIDEVGYVVNGDIELDGPIEKSNLYVVKAKMLKTNKPYSTQSTIGETDIYEGESLELPGLLETDEGYVAV